jgi:hypothetical protein
LNSLERAVAVMDRKIPHPVPIAMHNFLFAARDAGMRLQDCCRDVFAEESTGHTAKVPTKPGFHPNFNFNA